MNKLRTAIVALAGLIVIIVATASTFSSYTRVTSANVNSLLLLDATNVGAGTFTTKTISVSDLFGTISNGVDFVGGVGGSSGTLTISRGYQSTSPDISPYNGGGMLITPWGQGSAPNGLFLYNHEPGISPYPFTSGFDARPSGYSVERLGLRTYWANAKQEQGATFTAWNDSTGGSGAALDGLPAHGNEVWSNQRKPAFVIAISDNSVITATNCTQQGMTNTINAFFTNGWAGLMSNGVPCVYEFENYWLTNHRSGSFPFNSLAWNTNANKWPMAATYPSNVFNYLHTNGFEGWVMLYFDSVCSASNNTEVDIDALLGSTTWDYPNGANGISGSGLMQPMITPFHVQHDVTTFYQWGCDGITLQDTVARGGFSGYVEQELNSFSKAMLYPGSASWPGVQQRLNWAYYYPGRMNNHGMVLNYLYPPAYLPAAMSFEYSANGLALESGTFPVEPGSSGLLRQVVAMLRPSLYNLTNWQAKTTYWILNSDFLVYDGWDKRNCLDFLNCVATTTAHEWIRSNDGGALTNVNLMTLSTNANYLKIWQDTAQNRMKTIRHGATNSIFSKALSDGTYAVWLINEDPSNSTNLAVNLSAAGIASNTTWSVTECWTNTALATVSNSFSLVVPAASSQLVLLSPAVTKVWRGTLTQSGTAAPVAAVAKNELGGTIAFARTSSGIYTATLAGAFTTNKTTLYPQRELAVGAEPIYVTRTSADVITITSDADGDMVGNSLMIIVDP